MQGIERTPVDTFLRSVLRSGVLDRDQLQDGLRKVPRAQRMDPQALADHLIRNGKLTRFQAHKLLKGASMGLVLGPFQVLAPIGRGAMGTVYLSRDTRSNQLQALKVLPPKRARDEERLLARFRREMEMCQRVAHPHLAWTVDVGLCQGVHYIAMEYIPGKSLARIVAEQGPLAIPRAARLFSEIASALEHTHAQGLIHRDIKPSNVLVTPHDHAKVLDLGLAIMQGEKPTDRFVVGGQGYVVGTMDYISPEQANDPMGVDPRSDLYALGCTLYHCLTGQPPFPGGTNLEKIQRQRNEEPVPIKELNPSVPPAFVAIATRLMAKKPDDRYSSAAAVRDELLRWISGEPVLPLDKPEDKEFQQAVAAVEAEDTSAELIAEVAPPEPEEEIVRQAHRRGSFQHELPALEVMQRLSWPWLLGVLGGLLVLAATGLFGLYLLVR